MQAIRKNIIKDKNILYFDYTASGQGYKPIEKQMLEILKTYANTHSEVASSAVKTSEYYEKARDDLKRALKIDESFYLFPCGTGATGAIKKFQEYTFQMIKGTDHMFHFIFIFVNVCAIEAPLICILM